MATYSGGQDGGEKGRGEGVGGEGRGGGEGKEGIGCVILYRVNEVATHVLIYTRCPLNGYMQRWSIQRWSRRG